MVEQPERGRVFRCTAAVFAFANNGDGRHRSRQTLHRANLAVQPVCAPSPDAVQIKSSCGAGISLADSYCFYSGRDVAGAVVRVCRDPSDFDAGEHAFVAWRGRGDVRVAVAVCWCDILEADAIASGLKCQPSVCDVQAN